MLQRVSLEQHQPPASFQPPIAPGLHRKSISQLPDVTPHPNRASISQLPAMQTQLTFQQRQQQPQAVVGSPPAAATPPLGMSVTPQLSPQQSPRSLSSEYNIVSQLQLNPHPEQMPAQQYGTFGVGLAQATANPMALIEEMLQEERGGSWYMPGM